MDLETQTDLIEHALKLYEGGMKEKEIIRALAIFYEQIDEQIVVAPYVRNSIAMYESMIDSINEAGGRGWRVRDLSKISVIDMFGRLSTNGIRFVFKKEKK